MIAGGAYSKSIDTRREGKIKEQVVALVCQNGRETLRQLEAKTGSTRYLMGILARELVASVDVMGYPRQNWQNARKNYLGQR